MIEKFRNSKTTWKELEFRSGRDSENGTATPDSVQRLKLVLHLQYDRLESDEALLRYVLEQEVLDLEENYWGEGCTLEKAAFLLARFKSTTDIPLFIRAHYANFDTECAFPIEFAFVALGEKTFDHLREHHPDLAKQLIGAVSEFQILQTMDVWWESMQKKYPNSESHEEPFALFERCLFLGDFAAALQALNVWASLEPESQRKWEKLRFEYGQLGEYDLAATAAEKVMSLSDPGWDTAYSSIVFAKLCIKTSRFDRAAKVLRCLDVRHSSDSSNLRSSHIEQAFLLAAKHTDAATRQEMFALAEKWQAQISNLDLEAIDAGLEAADRLGLNKKSEEFALRKQEAKARLAKELNRIESKGD